jgi:ATP adenylyltransferase/5',5'''-P-1,P-4-tetraphosphate phosphorylase II
MLENIIFERYDSASSLTEQSLRLLHQQQQTWPQLIDGYAAFANVMQKHIDCNGFSVTLQCNPKRIVSSGAKIDAKTISERKCFLSIENLPPEQRGILYRNHFLVLCNPAPIVDQHFTISHVDHVPQAVEAYLGTLLLLAQDFSPSFTVFYNGPRCGASAPDHMHFQAGPAGLIPVEADVVKPERRSLARIIDGVEVLTLKNFGRQVIVLESRNAASLEAVFHRLMSSMREEEKTMEEPKVNIICTHAAGLWRLIVFPRAKHRPDVYFKEGDEQIMISPASIDIGGLPVTPKERDFERVDAAMIEHIYAEVSLTRPEVERIIAAM